MTLALCFGLLLGADESSMAGDLSWAEKFCLPATDYQGCVNYHKIKQSNQSPSWKPDQKRQSSSLEAPAREKAPKPLKASTVTSSTPTRLVENPLDSNTKKQRRWRRPDHDVVEFEPVVIRGPDHLNALRYIRWQYSLYYFLPGYHERMTIIPSPEDSKANIQRYGPMVWTVTGDCFDMTANWHGDRRPWRSVMTNADQSSKEARGVLEEFCSKHSEQAQKKAAP